MTKEGIRKRLEIYGVLLIIGAGVGKTFMNAQDEARIFRNELRSVKTEGALRDSTDGNMVTLQLQNISADISDIKDELDVTRSDIHGMNVTIVGGAAEHAALLDGKVTVIQQQVADLGRIQATLGDSLTGLTNRVTQLAESFPDTVVVVVPDTIEVVPEKPLWKKLVPGL